MAILGSINKITQAQDESVTKTANNIYLVDQTEVCQPNLLVNSNFKINQRGKTTYEDTSTSGAVTYGFDRWCIVRGKMTQNSNGGVDFAVRSASTSSNVNVRQYMIDYNDFDFNSVRNKWFTIAFSGYKTGQTSTISPNFRLVFRRANTLVWSDFGYTNVPAGTSSQITTYSFQFPDIDIDRFYFELAWSYQDTGMTIHIDWVKLELSDHFTGYQEPSVAEELPICQRYYQVIKAGLVSNWPLPAVVTTSGSGVSAIPNLLIQLPLERNMRTIPSLDTVNYDFTQFTYWKYDSTSTHGASSTLLTVSTKTLESTYGLRMRIVPTSGSIIGIRYATLCAVLLKAASGVTPAIGLDAEIKG